MDVSNPYAFTNLLSKLFENIGNPVNHQDEIILRTCRSPQHHTKCGYLRAFVEKNNRKKVELIIAGWIPDANEKSDLLEISKEWSIPISSYSHFRLGSTFTLNRIDAFKSVISDVIHNGKTYGNFHRSCQSYMCIRYSVHSEDKSADLSETRVVLAAKVIKNLLRVSGHEIEVNPQVPNEKEPVKEYFFTHKSTDECLPHGSTYVVCGVVLNADTGCKETTQTAGDYCRQWEDTISRISQERDNGEPREVQSEINTHIARAAVLFNLLGVKLNSCVTLRPPTLDNQQCYGVNSKGAPFILYNTARLASILSKFFKKVDSGYYPELPPLDQVDMSLLTHEEEWAILFHFIMIYPYVITEALYGLNKGKPILHRFILFLNAFCIEISAYYRKHRILTEPRSQLLSKMFARIYFLQAIQHVLHNALDILGVKPLLHM